MMREYGFVLRVLSTVSAVAAKAARVQCIKLVLYVLAISCLFTPLYGEEDVGPEELAKAREAVGSEAVKAYRALATAHPHSQVVWYELGEALYDEMQWSEALNAYQQSTKLGRKSEKLHIRMGKCFEKLKRYAEAEKEFRAALELKADAVAAQFGLGAALFNQDKNDVALPIFQDLAKRSDEWGEVAREYLAETQYALAHYDEALSLSEEALKKSPNDPGLHWLAAKALYKRRRFSEALPHFQFVAEHDSKRAEGANYYIASCLSGLGRREEAEAAYTKIARGSSVWSEAARKDVRQLAGPGLRFVLDYSAGYDTNVLRNNPDNSPAGQQDGFNQIYLDVMARVLRKKEVSLWLGVEHYSLHYFELHENDYIQDAPRLLLNFPKVGPFNFVSLRYQFNVSELNGDSYRREHRTEAGAIYQRQCDRLSLDIYYSENEYSREFNGVNGPEFGASIDYRHALPGRDHSLRVRLNTEMRFSDAETERRNVERARVQYRTKIADKLYGQIEGQYRRTDYPHSQGTDNAGDILNRRIDDRWSGEVQFDFQILSRLYLNWGYLYERQDSTREVQRYSRQQGNLGFTLQF